MTRGSSLLPLTFALALAGAAPPLAAQLPTSALHTRSVGSANGERRAVDLDSIHVFGQVVHFQTWSTDDARHRRTVATVSIDCAEKTRRTLHADVETDGHVESTAAPENWAYVQPGTIEAREMAAVCPRQVLADAPPALPAAGALAATGRERAPPGTAGEQPAARGPRARKPRLATAVIVSSNGFALAPHDWTWGCTHMTARVGGRTLRVERVADEADVTILKIAGGPFVPVPMRDGDAAPGAPLTILGMQDGQVHVAAGNLLAAGANRDDPGWQQVATLREAVVPEGAAWDEDGAVVGFTVSTSSWMTDTRLLRLLPAAVLRRALQAHAAYWDDTRAAPAPGAAEAMRRNLAATAALACE